MEAWLDSHEMLVSDVLRFKTKMKEVMMLEKIVLKRVEGMKFKTIKFHGGLHVWEDILNNGVPSNVNTRSDEKNHKSSKTSAKQTQRRPKTFDYQTAVRLHELTMLDIATEEIVNDKLPWDYFMVEEEEASVDDQNPVQTGQDLAQTGQDLVQISQADGQIAQDLAANNQSLETQSQSSSEADTSSEEDEVQQLASYKEAEEEDSEEEEDINEDYHYVSGTTLDFFYSEEEGKCVYRVNGQMRDKHKVRLEQALYNELERKLKSLERYCESLTLYTEYHRHGYIFRAHPHYYGKPWYDWVILHWGKKWGKLPAQIRCILDMRDLPDDAVAEGHERELYLIVESTVHNKSPAEMDLSELFVPYRRYVQPNGSRKFYWVSVESIVQPGCMCHS